jgi:hypothetical protein
LPVENFVEIAVRKDEFRSFSELSVGGFGAVLAKVVVFGNVQWDLRIGRSGRVIVEAE